MSEPFLAEVKIMSFNFPPKGWAFCNGQFLPINQNQALFSLLGTQLRRQRADHLRAAGPAGARAHSHGRRLHHSGEQRRSNRASR